ncbi:MAG: HD-GYP domain-containing protein [Azonexus sp.]|nr:HD-GYP domain-containing protein [Azonexus sp.]MCK6412746.1 HD-GYP domain-containing protein [Azonexus sp.]
MTINPFSRRAALRIAGVSLLLAALASPLAWYVARGSAEETTVALAAEESRRLLQHYAAFGPQDKSTDEHALAAAQAIVGGLFDIAEIYDAAGNKRAEAMTASGAAIEALLPPHQKPKGDAPDYLSMHLPDGRWALRVMVPLADAGYFEGVRVVPEWQRRQVRDSALSAALLAALAALLCGAAIYPVVLHLSRENEQKAREVLDSHIAMMEALGRAIAKRDSDTGAHNYRVAWTAARIAERMGFRSGAMQALIAGSFLHDVGKIGIPDAILLKPGKLDAEEFAIMRTHVAQGEDIVHGMDWLDGAHAVVAGHHEKWDGSGYPRRLAGEDIPLAARIFAVADVFDALCSRRPYKEPLPFAAAMEILERDSGSHFDPAVIAVFRELAADIHAQLADCGESELRRLLTVCVRRHFEV